MCGVGSNAVVFGGRKQSQKWRACGATHSPARSRGSVRSEDSLPGRDFANWTSLCINWVTNFETSNVDDWNVASEISSPAPPADETGAFEGSATGGRSPMSGCRGVSVFESTSREFGRRVRNRTLSNRDYKTSIGAIVMKRVLSGARPLLPTPRSDHD